MPDQTMTADQVHAQVHALRATAATTPASIELGRQQRAAIEASMREAAGTDDIGPLREFQGLPIVKSRRDDHVQLLATGEDGEDVAVENTPPATQPEELIAAQPESTVEAAPSGD
jgi:hypothetical protein